MARLPDVAGNPFIVREISPDGALALDRHRCFDPRDIHEQSEQWRPELYDALSGALILGLTALNRDCIHRWRADGGVDLELVHPHIYDRTFVSVTPGADGWEAGIDGGAPGLVGHVKTALARLHDPSRARAAPPPQPRRIEKMLGIVGAIILFGGGTAWMARDWWHGALRMPKIADVSGFSGQKRADGRRVFCPAPIGAQSLRLDADGQLLAPRLAQGPLPPVAGKPGRYAGAALTVMIEGDGVILWPDNDPARAVACRPIGG